MTYRKYNVITILESIALDKYLSGLLPGEHNVSQGQEVRFLIVCDSGVVAIHGLGLCYICR